MNDFVNAIPLGRAAASMNDRNKKIAALTALASVVLLLWLLFSPWGLIANHRLKEQLAETSERNQELTAANNRMQQEIERLKSDTTYLAKVAREQYGMLRKNEVVYVTPPPKVKEKH